MSKLGKMSEDRVRFFFHFRYYKIEMTGVMAKAFGIESTVFADLRRNNAGGFWIVCRPSQFARFMIYRHNVGVCNGFKDLNAALFQPCQKMTIAEALAAEYGQSVDFFCEVLQHVGIDGTTKTMTPLKDESEIEVWSNPHEG